MSNHDAKCLLDENFIAMDESFDRLEDDSNRYFAESNKYKKKSGFHFTSSWRKPKIGRRKTKSVGKTLVDSPYDMSINEYDDFPTNDDSTRGKIVKGRESFDSFASVPLSDFDHVKDNLAFMNFRSGNNSNRTKSPKEKLNPKMFLTQPPVNRRDIKNKFKKDRVARKKLEEEEPRDIFKPIHNTNMNNDTVFDAFQIIPKESPNKSKPKELPPLKMKPKEEPVKKPKEEPSADLYDKENMSFYCGDLYNDHGPILSSLSEDTINSDSVRGEQFLEDEEPKNQWNSILSPNFEELSKDSWELPALSHQNFVQPAKTIEPLVRPTKVESSVGSFNDRLKQFQTKDTQPTPKVRSNPIKPKSIAPVTASKVVNYEEEAPEDETRASIESASVAKESVPEKIASDKLEASTISKPDEQASSTQEKKVETSKWKTSGSSYYNRYGGYSKPSGALNNRFKEQMQTNSGSNAPTSSFQADSYKRINQQKSFDKNEASDIPKKKIIVPSSEKVKSSVVDLSMLETFRKNQAASKSVERESSASQRNSTDPSVVVEEENANMNKVEKDSGVSNRLSEFSTRSTRSYMSNYRPSTSSDKSTSQAPSWARRESKPKEIETKPEIETVTKSESSESDSQHSQIVSSDESKDHSAPAEKEAKTTEKKQENAHDSFRAARMRFGGKLQQNKNKFEKKSVSNVQKEEINEEKEETSDKTRAIQLDTSEVEDTKKKTGVFAAKKSFESLKSEVTADDRTSISSAGILKSTTTKPSFAKKSSFDPTPKKTNVAYKKPSLETSIPAANVVDATVLETENKSVSKREISNESTANTSISTLTVDSAPRTSYAQQSASIFGVTLSKRKKKIESVPEPMESPTKKQAIGPHVFAKKSDVKPDSEKLQTTEPSRESIEKELPVQEKKKSFGAEDAKRKISTSSVSVHSVEIKAKQVASEPKQEEKPRVVDRFPLKNSRQEVVKSDASDLKTKITSFPRKVKTSSIADRLKMFDKPAVTSQIESNIDDDNVEDAETSDSPKSIMTSGSTSSFEVSSVATKRRETESGLISESDIVQSEVEKVETLPYKTSSYRKYSNDNENYEVSERRRTLKSVRRTTNVSSSFKPQPASEAVNKPEVQKKKEFKFGNDNSLRARLSTLRTLKSEDEEDSKVDQVKKSFKIEPKAESKVAQLKKSFKSEPKEETKLPEKSHKSEEEEEKKVDLPQKSPKSPSPPTRDAYSMRRKFFENIDRKRVQASMSRPLITQTESMSTNHQSPKGHEIEIIGDDILRENNDLPMCVEFDEDFMLRDNISTCLSASENRSVICKPDALLYSVSQKAMALMSAKAESNSMRSYSRTYQEDEKGTIDNGLKFNRFKSSGNAGSSNYSELRNRFSQRNNEKEVTDDVQKDDSKYQQTNKFGKSDFSQRSNRFTSNKVTSEVRRQSNDDATDKKCESSIDDKKSIEKSTAIASFNQSKSSRLSENKAEKDTSKTVEDKPLTTYNSQPKDIGSMTVKERLEYFKSQRKRRVAATKKPEKEEPKPIDDSRKSSISVSSRASSFNNGAKNRPSDGSEMTPLVGAGFAEQSISTSLKRVSSNSMGTLDYSMQSSSYSRPSDYSKNRVSSASNNTHGTSSSRYNYRKGGYSSAAGNR